MKKIFPIALISQTIFLVLFVIHRFFSSLDTDLMFILLIASSITGLFLVYESIKDPAILGIQKILGLVFGFMPFVWILLFLLYIAY
jgi:hypothetical protein